MVAIRDKSTYEIYRSLVIDDFNKILDSENAKEFFENYKDFEIRFPLLVAYRCSQLKKIEKL